MTFKNALRLATRRETIKDMYPIAQLKITTETTGNTMLEVPENCMEIPGVILVIEPEKYWLTIDGYVTEVWEERGIWPNEEEAMKMVAMLPD